jgi:hypothetical protein
MINHQSLKKITLVVILIATLASCNQGLTLQTYYVDNELKPGFASLDIPTSFLDLEEMNLSAEELEAYDSIDKLNMLAFIADSSNQEQFTQEVTKVQSILKTEKYGELMRGGSARDGKFSVKFLGDPESLDELILFGFRNEQGFAIVRVLGDDMNANQIVKLVSSIQKSNVEGEEIAKFFEFLQ